MTIPDRYKDLPTLSAAQIAALSPAELTNTLNKTGEVLTRVNNDLIATQTRMEEINTQRAAQEREILETFGITDLGQLDGLVSKVQQDLADIYIEMTSVIAQPVDGATASVQPL